MDQRQDKIDWKKNIPWNYTDWDSELAGSALHKPP